MLPLLSVPWPMLVALDGVQLHKCVQENSRDGCAVPVAAAACNYDQLLPGTRLHFQRPPCRDGSPPPAARKTSRSDVGPWINNGKRFCSSVHVFQNWSRQQPESSDVVITTEDMRFVGRRRQWGIRERQLLAAKWDTRRPSNMARRTARSTARFALYKLHIGADSHETHGMAAVSSCLRAAGIRTRNAMDALVSYKDELGYATAGVPLPSGKLAASRSPASAAGAACFRRLLVFRRRLSAGGVGT